MSLQTPILFLIFNRPSQTLQVLEKIREQQPARLFIAADGPRESKPGENFLCEETRKAVLQNIDWPCEVHTLFREENLGCGKAVSSAITWFFEEVEEGIILEDDCIPDPTFFHFCTTLLAYYREDTRIMHIGGTSYQMGIPRGEGSYYFSRYAHIWGWASWRRAWAHYDFTLEKYRKASRKKLNRRFLSDLENVYEQRIDTWDIQWFMSVWFCKGYTIIPQTNLVRNIGYGKDATHTLSIPAWFRKMIYGSIPSMAHPGEIRIDEDADALTTAHLYNSDYLTLIVKKIVKQTPFLYNLYRRIS